MAERPKLDERIWIGFIETFFSEDLEGMRRDGRRIRDDAADYFKSIDVGLMFLPAAVTIRDWLREETEY
jgi:hypothetical protein